MTHFSSKLLLQINVKKRLQFIHTVNGNRSKTAKIIKKCNIDDNSIASMSVIAVNITVPNFIKIRQSVA